MPYTSRYPSPPPRSFELRNGFEARPFFLLLRPTSKTNLKNGFGIFLTREQRVALLVTNSNRGLGIIRNLSERSVERFV